jgi:hypothetical protein
VVRVPLVVRGEASGGTQKVSVSSKVKVDINWKEKNKKNKHAGMFEEVIDTSKLKITVSKHMFLRKKQLKTTKW